MLMSNTPSVLELSIGADLFQWVTPEDDDRAGEKGQHCDLGPDDADGGDDSIANEAACQNLPPASTDSDPPQPKP